jgi:zinc transporter ZupT
VSGSAPLVLILIFHVIAADKQRAVHYFAYHRQLNPDDDRRLFSRAAIADYASTGAHRLDCNSASQQYVSTFPNDLSLHQLHEICNLVTSCQTTESLQQLVSLIHNNQTAELQLSDAVVDLCPVLFSHSKDADCPKNKLLLGNDSPETREKHSALLVWGMAFLCVTIISLTSLVGVVIVPFLNKASYLNVLNLFEGLAVGSLVGSAIFHLIPQAFDLTISPNKHEYLWKALVIFFGIYLFYWSERIMNMISNSQQSSKPQDATDPSNGDVKLDPEQSLEQRLRTVSDVITHTSGHSHAHEHAHLTGGKKKIATVAWMIIFGDGLHNFIDGLSIGAAFNDSILTGISICVAVVCEEFPHELGDFAVLIASGMSIKQAVGFNFLSACTW